MAFSLHLAPIFIVSLGVVLLIEHIEGVGGYRGSTGGLQGVKLGSRGGIEGVQRGSNGGLEGV
jgi:hypothetical protein